MKALIWEAPSKAVMSNIDLPQISAEDILVRVGHAGICGSELSSYLGHNSLRVPPLIMGHEFAGEIVEVGSKVSNLKAGQLVTVNPLWYCGDCAYCKRGLNQLCMNRRLLGAHFPGAYAEYISVPAKLALPLPDGMSTRIGALTEPVGCGVRIGEIAGEVAGKDCLIIGAGPIGLLALQALKLKGAARVYVAEIDTHRLKMAETLGAIPIQPKETDTVETIKEATDGMGVAVSVDAVGTALTRDQCLKSTHATGTMIVSGLHEETSALNIAGIIRSEITVKGAFAYSPANFATALDLLAEGKIQLDPWIIESPLHEGGKWFDRLIESPGNVSKVLLVPAMD